MAKAGTSSAKVVRRERRELTSLCFILHDTPNDLQAEPIAPNPDSLIDRTKERAGCNSGGRHPDINSSFHPVRNRGGSYVPALADEIGNDPMLLSLLYVFNAQCGQFPSGGGRKPAKWPTWHSLAYLGGLYCLSSTTSACLVRH